MCSSKMLRHGHVLVYTAILVLSACGARQDRPESAMDDADSWTHRTVWTEKKGDRVVVRVVGRAGHVSLDESMAYDNAEQDAREKLAI